MMKFSTSDTLIHRFFYRSVIFATCICANAEEPIAKHPIFRVGDPLLEIREALYTEDLHLVRGFAEDYSRLQMIVQKLRPELIRLNKELANGDEVSFGKEIDQHFDSFESAAYYEAHRVAENHHEAAMLQETAKVNYLENRICYLMRKHFGENEGFAEWSKEWTKERSLEVPEAEPVSGYPELIFENENFKVTVDNRAPEGHVTSDDVHFEVIEIETGKSTKGKGSTVHTLDREGTPKRFLGYKFASEHLNYYISRFGEFRVFNVLGDIIHEEKLESNG